MAGKIPESGSKQPELCTSTYEVLLMFIGVTSVNNAVCVIKGFVEIRTRRSEYGPRYNVIKPIIILFLLPLMLLLLLLYYRDPFTSFVSEFFTNIELLLLFYFGNRQYS